MNPSATIAYLDAPRLERAMLAGIGRVVGRRDHLNRINVFPVADSDTGTNLSFTLREVQRVIGMRQWRSLGELLDAIADAALDGARGNSGAILAQYFHGLRESCRGRFRLDAADMARATGHAAESAWSAMAEPVAGTLPTVLADFGEELTLRAGQGVADIRVLFEQGFSRARDSLANTPNQLAVLRESGVVDAGAQGFVDFLEGISLYIEKGESVIPPAEVLQDDGDRAGSPARPEPDPGGYRYCTECLLTGQEMDVAQLRRELAGMAADSLVVAGGGNRLRVHLHTDEPGQAFDTCARFGQVVQRKADDMANQHRLLNQAGQVAIVTDSAADLPADEMERLGIHMVPVRLIFGEEEYLDKLTIQPEDFYRRLARNDVQPQTSQPPLVDFRRQYELLADHGHQVLGVHLSSSLSGTFQAASQAAGRLEDGKVALFDTLNAACGQGLLVLYAGEAAAAGWTRSRIVNRLEQLRGQTRSFALVRDLSWGVRGGRVKPWMHWLARNLKLNPVLGSSPDGRLTPQGVIAGKRRAIEKFARLIARKLDPDTRYRMIISHTDASADAESLEKLLEANPAIESIRVEPGSPAVGAHAGPGTLVAGFMPWVAPEAEK